MSQIGFTTQRLKSWLHISKTKDSAWIQERQTSTISAISYLTLDLRPEDTGFNSHLFQIQEDTGAYNSWTCLRLVPQNTWTGDLIQSYPRLDSHSRHLTEADRPETRDLTWVATQNNLPPRNIRLNSHLRLRLETWDLHSRHSRLYLEKFET